MIYQNIVNLDHYLFKLINSQALRWEWLGMLGIFFADYFPYFTGGFLLLFMLKFRKNWKMVLSAFVAAAITRFGVVEAIRWFKPRVRPFNAIEVNLLVGKVNELSFPSGHATFFFSLATVVFLNNKKVGCLFYAAASLISIARVFVGLHYPLDIFAGAVLGIIIGWLTDKLFKKYIFKTQ